MSRTMGIDYGKKRIGIAISDELKLFAYPYTTITNTNNKDVFANLKDIIESNKISDVVVGLPFHDDGKPSDITELVNRFVDSLKNHIEIPVSTFDERYSTCEAREILVRNKITLKQSKALIDRIAAAVILQNHLDSLSHSVSTD